MKEFNLSEWLQDKSRKVVTRDGRPVRIICTDRKGKSGNIVGLVCEDESLIYVWNNDGKHMVSEIPDNDIFFADEEELTEFQNKLFSVLSEVWQNYLLGREIDIAEPVKEYSPELLDLARKELQPEIDKELEKAYKTQDDVVYRNGYAQGKQDALKVALESLPKWKKAKECRDLPDDVVKINENGKIIYSDMVWEGEYFIMLQSLKSLPKEE